MAGGQKGVTRREGPFEPVLGYGTSVPVPEAAFGYKAELKERLLLQKGGMEKRPPTSKRRRLLPAAENDSVCVPAERKRDLR